MDIQDVKDKIIPIIKKYHVSRASLFGSIVSGTMNKDSDIDLLVELPPDSSLFDMLRVKVSLEEKLNKRVDLVQYKAIKAAYRKEILASQFPIYSQA